MRSLIIIVFSLAFAGLSHAKEHKNVGDLNPDKLRVLSPDGEYELWNQDNIFVINPRGIDGSFFSDDVPELEDSLRHNALYATWSPDSRMVAVCVPTGKYIEHTFVFLRQPRDAWRCLRLPCDDPDSQVVPLKWLDATTLMVEISGSYGGKADHDIYFYTATFKYNPAKHAFTKASVTKPHTKKPHYQ